MTNPLIPGITAAEQDVLYQKLNEYNLKKASFKEVGAYLVVLPRADYPRYSLWIYSPLPERQSIFYIFDLSEDIHEALRMAPICRAVRYVREMCMSVSGVSRLIAPG